MRVAVYGKSINNYNAHPIQRLITKLENLDAEIILHEEFYLKIKPRIHFEKIISTFTDSQVLSKKPDFFCSIGGDGTMLNTVTFVGRSNIPIIGFNTGRLGFLSGISIDDIERSLDQIKAGAFKKDKRTLLRLESDNLIFGKLSFALNEIVVQRQESSTMITIHAYINGEFLNSYWADGLIISTPTGSTAYSLSCGGPLVMPDSENLIVTPIAPHNLNVRPIVISDKDVLTLKVESRTPNYMVALDSRANTFHVDHELTIKKEDFSVNLVRTNEDRFLETLRQKLMWGIDKRN